MLQSVPTGSLYKFVPVSGVLLVIASLYYPFKYAYSLDAQLTKHELDVNKIIIDINRVEEVKKSQLKFYENQVSELNTLKSDLDSGSNIITNEYEFILNHYKFLKTYYDDNNRLIQSKSYQQLTERAEELLKKEKAFQMEMSSNISGVLNATPPRDFDETIETMENLEKRKLDIFSEGKLLDSKKIARKNLMHCSLAGTIVGLALAIWGFYMWYVKDQKYRDIILERSSKI